VLTGRAEEAVGHFDIDLKRRYLFAPLHPDHDFFQFEHDVPRDRGKDLCPQQFQQFGLAAEPQSPLPLNLVCDFTSDPQPRFCDGHGNSETVSCNSRSRPRICDRRCKGPSHRNRGTLFAVLSSLHVSLRSFRTHLRRYHRTARLSPQTWAECLFVDPIGDIAILGPPDYEALPTEFDVYQELVQSTVPLKITSPATSGHAWLLSLDNKWFSCLVRQVNGPLWIFEASEGIMGGMSGSPIIVGGGSAIGVLCTSGGTDGQMIHTNGGPNPRMDWHLPAWLLHDLNWAISPPG
jgi:hypothetical protein